jgi:Fe2+ or Zn2+ uptake regulation protein
VVEFEGCDLSSFLERVSQKTGFIIDEHLLELVGRCPACQ